MSQRAVRVGLVGALILVLGFGTGFLVWRRGSDAAVKSVSTRLKRRSLADEQITAVEAKLRKLPDHPDFYAELATAFMHKARETGDGAYYTRAEAACLKALELAPDHYAALRLVSWIYSGQHRFREALVAAQRALAIDPKDPFNYGTLGDALVELGDYQAAADAFQKMVDLRPDVASYSRAAYIRELYGDPEGAIRIMQMAVKAAGSRDLEQNAWCRTQLGNLFFNTGWLAEADAQYNAALEIFPDYHYALTGLGRVRGAQQRFEEAVRLYQRSLEVVPTHEAAVALGDLFLYLGRADEAREPFALLDVIEQINRANQVQPESQMALFYADHDRNLGEALRIAEQQARERQGLRTMDALAWALYKTGRYQEALAASRKALRLGTKEALFHYHAGMIQAKLGQRKGAVAALRRALEINPYFHPRQADEARRTLETLSVNGSTRQ
jgi:tetratricopeptide (TPR) repeat protein